LFDYVFIDEASMVPLGIAIIPIHYGLRRVILGDTRQLPPITRSPQHTEGAESILQLLVSSGEVPVVHLSVQRRGVKEIFDYVSEAFYQGRLRTAYSGKPITFRARYNDVIDEALTSGSPILWVDVDGRTEWVEVRRGKYTSYSAINRDEACLAVAIYRRLREYGVGRDEIAIISTYRAQSILIAKAVEKLHLDEPAIAYLVSTSEGKDSEGVVDEEDVESLLDLRVSSTVDSYQGREKDIIIYSMTADRYHRALANYARFNVAISRAKRMLVLLSSMVEDDLKKLPWIHGLSRRSYRTSIDVSDAGNDVCKAVDDAISELWSA
jgi:superfamily I DNA and/or RNA helicase